MERLPRLSLTDWGVPALVAIVVLTEIGLVRPNGVWAAAGLGILSCLALVWRRPRPLLATFVAGTLSLVTPWFGPELEDLAAPILVMALVAYSLARWVRGYDGVPVLSALILILGASYLFTDERANDVTDVFFVAALLAPPYVLGRVARKLAEQAELLTAQQELIRDRAIRDERDRIARDLHDVIAHSVSAMVVQTAAAQDLLRSDPIRAADVLEHVADTGRHALAETGRLLHLIRDGADELGIAPAPGLADLPDLVERFRAQGLEVDLDVDVALPTLPGGVDVSAYRIVQEALTNALRYGVDRRVRILIRYDDEHLRIQSSNAADGRTGDGSGLGLLGIAERVGVLGGRVTHELTAQGRFELDAALPVGS